MRSATDLAININDYFSKQGLFTRQYRRWLSTFLLCAAMSALPGNALSQGVEYQAGKLDIRLSENVEDAIHNGVPLTFVCEYAIVNSVLFVSWKKQHKDHRFVVTHHALSNSYLVSIEAEAPPKIFRTLTEAMSFVARQAQILFAAYHLSEKHTKMRVRLGKTELPGPMRLNAFIAKEWDLDTGWKAWQSAR